MSVKPAYRYTALHDPFQEIRILKVNGTRNNNSPLVGTITVHKIPLRDASRTKRLGNHLRLPAYLAVSYVWGTGPSLLRSHEVIVDEQRLPITANIHACLLSYRGLTPNSIRYWIDAICINQEDIHEKSAQVPLMRDIFHLAIGVPIWLGEETPDTKRVEEFISKFTADPSFTKFDDLAKELTDIGTENAGEGRPKRHLKEVVVTEVERIFVKGLTTVGVALLRGIQIQSDVVLNSLNNNEDPELVADTVAAQNFSTLIKSWEPNDEQVKAVEGEDFQEITKLMDKVFFSDTEYFSRMWTLQEFAVAHRGIALMLGTPAGTIASVLLYLQRTYNINSLGAEKITILLDVTACFRYRQRLSLRSLLALSAGRRSQDPRDRIYAIEGLMKDEMNPLLQPSYTKPVVEVYANTSRHIIFTEKSLDILCGHPHGGRFPELPSWVPDFRNFGLNIGPLVDANGANTIYHASLSTQYALPDSPFQLTEEWKTLPVAGIYISSVSELSDVAVLDQESKTEGFAQAERLWSTKLKQSQQWKLEELEAIDRISDIVARYDDYYQDSDRTTFGVRNEDKLQTLRTITENFNENEDALDLQYKYFCTLLCGRVAPGTRCNAENLREHTVQLCSPGKDGIEALEALCKGLDTGTRGRRLVVSGDNHIGAVPEGTRKCDGIYVLMGCSVPVILRKTERHGEFEFVGECYLHGFMDGEALAIGSEGEATTQEFKLV